MIMKRNDGILLALLLLLAGALFLFQPEPSSAKADFIEVLADGKQYGVWPLDTPQIIKVVTAYGQNEIRVKDNAASVVFADCSNQDCMRQKQIINTGDTVVCLPHKLVIVGKSGRGITEVDAVSR